MTEETYEQIKAVLADNEHLFSKLAKVAREYNAIDFDESGFYHEEAERCERHWKKLAMKLRDAMQNVKGIDVSLLQNKEPNICSLRFDVTVRTEEEAPITTRLTVDYATEGQISIDRRS